MFYLPEGVGNKALSPACQWLYFNTALLTQYCHFWRSHQFKCLEEHSVSKSLFCFRKPNEKNVCTDNLKSREYSYCFGSLALVSARALHYAFRGRRVTGGSAPRAPTQTASASACPCFQLLRMCCRHQGLHDPSMKKLVQLKKHVAFLQQPLE